MVAMVDLDRINELSGEDQTLSNGLEALQGTPRIVNMTVVGEDGSSVMLPTADMYYPQQMIDMIKQQVTQRQTTVRNELTQLGMTGIGAGNPEPLAAQAAQAQAQPHARRH